GFTFERWEGAAESTENTVSIIMDSAITVFFLLVQRPPRSALSPLTVPVRSEGAGTVDSMQAGNLSCDSAGCVWTFSEGEEVGLTANPGQGFTFERWEGAAESTENTVSIIMDSAKTVIAVFAEEGVTPEQPVLTVSVFPEGAGSVDSMQTGNLSCDSAECVWTFSEGEEVGL
ncbi:MAG: hypothetical protein GY679_00970, partial [Mycoplasma sp.]|nr:hypothetical protein [Mycoplasma sp.]